MNINTFFISIFVLFFTVTAEQKTKLPSDFVKMIVIPGEGFMMGSNEKRTNGKGEYPAHPVEIDSFKMAVHEITQAQFKEIMGFNHSLHKGENLPVERVSWFDAVRFCNFLSELSRLPPYYEIVADEGYVIIDKAGKGYRLPTEAEFEFVLNPLPDLEKQAWFYSNSKGLTHPVATKAPNRFGLYDVYGNVFEWTQDWFDKEFYKTSPIKNPKGAAAGRFKVLKGGAMDTSVEYLRPSYRYDIVVEYTSHNIGFRVARNL